MASNNAKTFVLVPQMGEIFHLNGIPYMYVGGCEFEGGTPPEVARSIRVPDSGGTKLGGGNG